MRRPWVAFGAAALVACSAASAIHFKLALTPDRVVSAQIRSKTVGARNVAEAASRLRRSYAVLGSGFGAGWVKDSKLSAADREKLSTIQVVVGEYQGVPFKVTVDALILVDDVGTVKDVVVRRTGDGP